MITAIIAAIQCLNLSVTIDGVMGTNNYNRSLDFNGGIHTTIYTAGYGSRYAIAVYCSYPHRCLFTISAPAKHLPQIIIDLENFLMDSTPLSSRCGTSFVRLTGVA